MKAISPPNLAVNGTRALFLTHQSVAALLLQCQAASWQ